jgi:hypothetical protein
MAADVIDLFAQRILVRRAEAAAAAKVAVMKAWRRVKKATNAQVADGMQLVTDEALTVNITVTMSIREALALARVAGPIGLQNGDRAATRVLTAIYVLNSAILRAPSRGVSLEVVSAIQVLQCCLNDHLWQCRDVEEPGAIRRRPGRPVKRVGARRGMGC